MTDWIGMLWVLVPVTAIICGVVYSIARLRWGADHDAGSRASIEQNTAAQREVANALASIERRLDGIEKVLHQVD